MSGEAYCTRIVLEVGSERKEEAEAVGLAVLKLLGGFGDATRELCRGHSSLYLKATAYPSRRIGLKVDDGAVVAIARVCHEAKRGWCEAGGDHSQRSWNEAEQWQRDSAIAGVRFALDNPDAPASAQHDAWSRDKAEDGWTYGPAKDAAAKTHPCLVPFEQLPAQQQAKDRLFQAVVASLAGL